MPLFKDLPCDLNTAVFEFRRLWIRGPAEGVPKSFEKNQKGYVWLSYLAFLGSKMPPRKDTSYAPRSIRLGEKHINEETQNLQSKFVFYNVWGSSGAPKGPERK